jgi:hypothetical protein
MIGCCQPGTQEAEQGAAADKNEPLARRQSGQHVLRAIGAYHLADYGAVDVLANDAAVWEGVTNGTGANTDVPADTYNIKITAAGDPATVAFDADVALAEGTNTIAYAVGSVADGNFQVVTAAITGLGTAPEGVPTGDAGLSTDTSMVLPIALAGVALLALGGGAVALAKRES